MISADVGSATHPMGDRIRTSLFNMLESQDVLNGAVVLDAFAGTGAVGFEALSRGARTVDFVEQDKRASRIITENVKNLGVSDHTKLYTMPVASFLKTAVKDQKYDLIFADPPYHQPQFSTVSELVSYLQPNALMILSYMSGETAPNPNGVVVVANRSYGEASLAIYRKVDN
jgi:16S rRNA (guanine966-N2)-methyltransferase